MKKFFQKKRLLSLFLSGVMIAGVMPTSVFAHQYEGVISSAYYDLNLPIEEREEEQRKRKELFDSMIKEDLELEISSPFEFNSVQAPRPTFEELVQDEDLDAKIAEIEKEINDKKDNLKNVDTMVAKGVVAFLDWSEKKYPQYKLDIEKGREIINRFIGTGEVDLSKKTDAGSFENLLRTPDYLERQNYLRIHDEHFKCEKQDTNFEILCKAIVSANRSTDPHEGHRHTFNVAENLAWGSNPDYKDPKWNDPFYGWYTEEKLMWEFQDEYIKTYLKDHPEASREEAVKEATKARLALEGTEYKGKKITNTQIGHYLNVVAKYKIVAIAVNTDKEANSYGATHAMNADFGRNANAFISEEKYREIIEDYKKATNKDEINKEIKQLEADLALAQEAKVEKDAQKAADEALTTLETKNGDVTDQQITDAKALIDKVTIQAKNNELNDRLNAIKEAKSELEAEKAADEALKVLEGKNGDVTDKEIADAKALIEKIKDTAKKSEFNGRLEKVKEAKVELEAQKAADEAIKALEGKNGNVTEQQIADAQDLVNKVTNEEKIKEFNGRLEAVKKAKAEREAAEKAAIDEATTLVEKAEADKTEEAYTAANEKVTALKPSGAKTELQERLVELDKYIQADNAIKALEAKNISAVTAKELTDAEALVNVVKEEWKTELTNRLISLKDKKADDDRRKEEEAKALAAAKEAAINKINELDKLSAAEKTDHIDKVNASNRVEDVNKALLDAQKNNAKNIVAELNKLKENEVTKANEDIDNATDENAINEIVEAAQKVQTDRQSLDEHKDEVRKKLGNLNNLTAEEKAGYNKKIDEAKTKEAADAIVLDAQKDNAQKEIDKMNLLKPEEASEAKQNIKNAPDENAIKEIVDAAQAKQNTRQELENYKTDAKSKVDTLDKLSQEDKDAYKARISDAETKEAVDPIVLEAQKDNAKKIVAGLDKLTDDEKIKADNDIYDATDEATINEIVETAQAKQNDRQALEDHKKEAKAKVDALDKLTDEEKTESKNKIDEATTKEAVDPIVLDAQKDNAKKKLEDLTKLNEEEKAQALKAIEEATNEESIDKAIKTAEASNVSLDELKAQAKNIINTLNKLSEEEKAAFNEKVDNADTKAKVNAIVAEAENLNASKEDTKPGNDDFLRPNDNDRPIFPWRPSHNFKPTRPTSTPAKPEIKPAPQIQEKIEIDSKLVIGSKTLVVSINGIEKEVVMDVEPFISNNRTMLPIRFVAEALGFKVEWDETTRTVILTNKDTVVKIPVDTNQIIVNGTVFESDVKPIIKSDRTMLPIANIARALGLVDGKDIIWDGTTKEVIIKRDIIK